MRVNAEMVGTHTTDADTDSTGPTAKLNAPPSAGLHLDVLYDRHLTILAFLWLVMLGVAVAALPRLGEPEPLPPAPATINPNVASWQDLTVLPRIGETRAKQIIRYRESATPAAGVGTPGRAFSCAADLAQVRGIGPKTVQRISPFLRFDER